MLIVYDSLMGKTEKFVKRTGFPHVKIHEELQVNEPFILVTYTCGRGDVPETTMKFLQQHHSHLKAVASSGHRNWGIYNFCKSGVIISEKYEVPLLLKFEMLGKKSDIKKFNEGVVAIEEGIFRVQQ